MVRKITKNSIGIEKFLKIYLFIFCTTGLIAAASAQLDAVLKKATMKTYRIINGPPSAIKAHLYEKATKLANGSLDGIYCNGTGLHV